MRLYEFSDGTVIDLEKLDYVSRLMNEEREARYIIQLGTIEAIQVDETDSREHLLEAWRKYHERGNEMLEQVKELNLELTAIRRQGL